MAGETEEPQNEDVQIERRISGLSAEQIEAIKEAILASVYADIGRSLVSKVLWAIGAVLVALLAWLSAKGYVK